MFIQTDIEIKLLSSLLSKWTIQQLLGGRVKTRKKAIAAVASKTSFYELVHAYFDVNITGATSLLEINGRSSSVFLKFQELKVILTICMIYLTGLGGEEITMSKTEFISS